MGKIQNTEFKEDCAHLRACRRMCIRARQQGHQLTRDCNDTCTAYNPIEDTLIAKERLYTYKEASFAVSAAASSAQYGESADDIWLENYV